MSYVELFAISNFTFLTGASHAAELVTRAKQLSLGGLAIADKNTFSGIVRGHGAAKELGLRYLVATRLCLTDGTSTGFCTRESCEPSGCGGDYLCCGDCDPSMAPMLPFQGSVCLPPGVVPTMTAEPLACSCR